MESIILASASPRRRELLTQIGIEYEVIPSKKEEVITSNVPSIIVQELSRQKAEDIVLKQKQEGRIVLGADTVVAFDGEVMGKPTTQKEAYEMLSKLQNAVHQVYTGVTLSYLAGEKINSYTFFEETEVSVYPMTEKEILAYIASGDPMDKAGSYGIQGSFAAYIKGIRGDYNNVVGLPVGRVYQELKKLLESK